MSISVLVDVQNASSMAGVPPEPEIRSWVEQAVRAVCEDDGAAYEVAVRIVDEAEGRELNRQFRRRNKATNVLSFAADLRELPVPGQSVPQLLGDVVICGPVVEREAEEQGKDPASHWGHLLLHGALHLLGYDHESAAQAARMEALERGLLAARGIGDPYANH